MVGLIPIGLAFRPEVVSGLPFELKKDGNGVLMWGRMTEQEKSPLTVYEGGVRQIEIPMDYR